MRQSINVDYYAPPPSGIPDRRGVIIIYTEIGQQFSGCKRQVITGHAYCDKMPDRKASPSSEIYSRSKGFQNSGRSNGLRHYWNVIDENGVRSLIRWDKLRRYKNKGELDFYQPEGDMKK